MKFILSILTLVLSVALAQKFAQVRQSLYLSKNNIMAYVIGNDCIACGTCIDECPVGAISEGEIYSINPDTCTECGTCSEVCPSEAISLPE